jgi:predicted lipid-binding transport protein (Tim44 family)
MNKTSILLLTAALTLGIASFDADAAKRFGGGGNLGAQRSSPAMKEAPKAPQQAAPAPSSPAAAPGAPATPPPKPSFMGRFGGILAGLGIGALLGSMFGGGMGSMVGILLMVLVVGGIAFMVMRMLAARGRPADKPMAYAGPSDDVAAPPRVAIGSNLGGGAEPVPVVAEVSNNIPPDFQVEPFLRQAKMAFIRLQAANDAKDLDDIRNYTTPEMYAEIAMQIDERLDAVQKTEVLNVHPTLIEVANEDGYEVASVRFAGLIRDSADANPESFDEVWHVKKKIGDNKSTWLIAGIQQLP